MEASDSTFLASALTPRELIRYAQATIDSGGTPSLDVVKALLKQYEELLDRR